MPAIAPIIFLSSRFDEDQFKKIRARLTELLRNKSVVPCHVVNLDENHPDSEPPLALSLEAARRADIVVLLVGQTYGSIPRGEIRSYTHLEYDAALRLGKAVVLPFFFNGKVISDSRQVAFRSEIFERHTVSQHPQDVPPKVVASHIFEAVQRRVFSLAAAVTQQDADVWLTADDELSETQAGEAVDQDRRIQQNPRLQLEDDALTGWKTSQLLLQPALVAAAEQKRHALRALGLGEWRLARRHLGQALERAPLDLAALFWQARLLLLTGNRDDARRALSFALRGARIAEDEVSSGQSHPGSANIPLAACCILAARAYEQLGDPEEGVTVAQQASSAAGSYWLTHYELARQHALAGNPAEAMKALQAAYLLRPTSLWATRNDAAFADCRHACEYLRDQLRYETREQVSRIVRSEAKLAADVEASRLHLNAPSAPLPPPDLAALTLFELIATAKDSFTRQVEMLSGLANTALELARREPPEHAREEFGTQTDKLKRRLDAVERWSFSRPLYIGFLWMAGVLALLVGGWATWLILRSHPWWGGLLMVVPLLLARIAWGLVDLFPLDDPEKAFEKFKEKKLIELQRALNDSMKEEHVIERIVATFVAGVAAMEEHCLYRRIFCPTAPLDTAAAGDLVRLDPAKHSSEYTIDDTLLPEILKRWGSDPSPAKHGNRLYRVRSAKPNGTASRRACYFKR